MVAPATADLLAKAAHGLADDLLTNTLLTARCPVVFAPAMHTEMWEHPATQANVATLRAARRRGDRAGRGPAHRRRHRQGPAARARRDLRARARGARARASAEPATWPAATSWSPPAAPASTSTRSGSSATAPRASRATPWPAPRPPAAPRSPWSAPTSTLPDPAGVKVVRVETTGQLRDAVVGAAASADAVVMAAAPADFRPDRGQRQQDQEGRRRLARRRRARPRTPTSSREISHRPDPRGLGRSSGSPPRPATTPARCSTSPAPSWPARAATCWSSTTSAGERSSAAPTTRR